MAILIVDDDKLICENIKSKLTRLKYDKTYKLLLAYNATEAEIFYDRYSPEIVITDIHMPAISGLVLIERLLNKEHKADIIVLSGYDDYEYVRKAFLLGVKDYMLKPVDIDELDRKIRKLQDPNPKKEDKIDDRIDVMELALDYIDMNINRSITMRDVAEHVGFSYNYFSKLFKDCTQTSFSDYMHKRRIKLSKNYLRDPRYKIYNIAEKVGYNSPEEFSRAFKRYIGCYPSEYRGE